MFPTATLQYNGLRMHVSQSHRAATIAYNYMRPQSDILISMYMRHRVDQDHPWAQWQ